MATQPTVPAAAGALACKHVATCHPEHWLPPKTTPQQLLISAPTCELNPQGAPETDTLIDGLHTAVLLSQPHLSSKQESQALAAIAQMVQNLPLEAVTSSGCRVYAILGRR